MARENNFHYASVPEPPEGIKPGTVLPASEFPEDNRCPYCEDRPKFKNSNGLRGHANGKHGVRWDIPKKIVEFDSAKMLEPWERETLKPWHMFAIILHDLYGYTWEKVGEKMERSADYLASLASSPAGKKLREHIADQFETPEKLALLMIKATTVDATVDYMVALDWAKEARDYTAVARMTKDLLTLAGAEERKEHHDELPRELHIHLDGADLELPFVSTDYKVIDVEIEDD